MCVALSHCIFGNMLHSNKQLLPQRQEDKERDKGRDRDTEPGQREENQQSTIGESG